MSGIKDSILDVLNRLSAIEVKSADGRIVPLYVRRYKNQIQREKAGEIGVYPKPAAFVECINDVTYEQIGVGVLSAELGFKIHLVTEFYNDENGVNYDLDLAMFDLMDVISSTDKGLSQFCPTGCGTLNRVSVNQDQDPDNVDIVTIDFICNFIDSKGSKLDENQGMISEITDIDLNVVKNGIPTKEKELNEYIIPQK